MGSVTKTVTQYQYVSSTHSQCGHSGQKDATHAAVDESNIYAIQIMKGHHLEFMDC